ncbi:MAG: glycoside hydrolase family 43 protein [Ignavibacteria bacterium]|nr:glycoside hydrolase family 43 protein [Ignavibacteria bacterium]
MKKTILLLMISLSFNTFSQNNNGQKSGNPILQGRYADPEGSIFGKEYWIFPTYSDVYEKQVFIDAFSSKDLITWQKHARVIDTSIVKWARKAMWAPSVIGKQNKFYLFFSANDLQRPGGPLWNEKDSSSHTGGIGIAVADSPGGPYKDYLGKPLVSTFYNNAQPIDQFVFRDSDGKHYLIYGGWGHCNIARLNDDFTGFIPFNDGTVFKEITPENYVEGPFMFIREGKYYFMWSEGGWGGPDYSVAYAVADNPAGPFKRIGKVLQQDKDVATGAGHHSIIKIPAEDKWYIVYHRRPLGETARDYRVVCIDIMFFDEKGFIKPIKMTNAGVEKNLIR